MMTVETASAEKDVEPARPMATGSSPEVVQGDGQAGTIAAGWLGHELLSHPANASVRTLALRRAANVRQPFRPAHDVQGGGGSYARAGPPATVRLRGDMRRVPGRGRDDRR